MSVFWLSLFFGTAFIAGAWAGCSFAYRQHHKGCPRPVQPRRRGRAGRTPNVWLGAGRRGVFAWVSIRLPGGFRIGHRL